MNIDVRNLPGDEQPDLARSSEITVAPGLHETNEFPLHTLRYIL
jgi:hypothetical protein